MRSIRSKLVVHLISGVTLLILGAGAGLYFFVEEMLEHALDTALLAKADAISNSVHLDDDGQLRLQAGGNDPGQSAHHEDRFYFQLWRSDGSTLARFTPPESGDASLPKPDITHRRFSNLKLPGSVSVRATLRVLTIYGEEDQDEPGHGQHAAPQESVTLVVAHDRRTIDQTLTVLLLGLAAAAVVLTVGIIAIVSRGVRRGLRPLRTLAEEVSRLGPATLQNRFSTDRLPLEIQPIVAKLNALLDRLQEAFIREKRFSSNVAHELRTPLAELRSLCDVTLKWPENGAGASAIAEAQLIGRQMEGSVDSLLSLMRVQLGMQELQIGTIDLGEIIHDAWASSAAMAIARQLRVEQKIGPCNRVRTDPRMLFQIFRNLFQNAVQHAPCGGEILIETFNENETVVARFSNTNASLSDADLTHLCEPFWRKDSARTDHGCAGLGLSIVKEYCNCLGISVNFTLPKPSRFQVSLTFADSLLEKG